MVRWVAVRQQHPGDLGLLVVCNNRVVVITFRPLSEIIRCVGGFAMDKAKN
jgi:hypothetical protein